MRRFDDRLADTREKYVQISAIARSKLLTGRCDDTVETIADEHAEKLSMKPIDRLKNDEPAVHSTNEDSTIFRIVYLNLCGVIEDVDGTILDGRDVHSSSSFVELTSQF